MYFMWIEAAWILEYFMYNLAGFFLRYVIWRNHSYCKNFTCLEVTMKLFESVDESQRVWRKFLIVHFDRNIISLFDELLVVRVCYPYKMTRIVLLRNRVNNSIFLCCFGTHLHKERCDLSPFSLLQLYTSLKKQDVQAR